MKKPIIAIISTLVAALTFVVAEENPSVVKKDKDGVITSDSFVSLFSMNSEQLRGIGVEEAPSITTHLHFRYDSVQLADDLSRRQLIAVGQALNHEKLRPYSFLIEGHTDSRGADAYNLKLSQARADAVAAFLVKTYGVDATRVTAVGKGEFEPVDPKDTEEAHQKNRRVVFRRAD